MYQTSSIDEELKLERSAVELYFLESDGSSFKATYVYKPYFFIAVSKDSLLQEVEAYLLRRFDGQLDSTSIVAKEDLELVRVDSHL
jgi:DNA polymerase epsilon subunit 1